MYTRHLPFSPHSLSVALVALLLAGCDLTSTDDGLVGGVDVDALFAPPTADERNAILDKWADRDLSVRNFEVLGQRSEELENGDFDIQLVRHEVDGKRHVGAFIVPSEADGPLSLIIYNHGGDSGVSIDDDVLPLITGMDELGQAFAYVVPAFRSQSVEAGGFSFTSEGEPSPWDGDVDDALALLNAATENLELTDGSRIGVIGFSRGATVAQLMAIRDDRIDAVVSFFGLTDFYGPFVRQLITDALRDGSNPPPGMDVLIQDFIEPLQRGDLSIQDVRSQLTRRSVVEFAGRLPALQVHHGEDDPVIPTEEALALDDALEAAGRSADTDASYELFIYESNPPYPSETLEQHDSDALPQSLQRTATFFQSVLLAETAPASIE